MKIETFILPSFWASYLINGDISGYSEEELKEIETFERSLSEICTGECLDMGETLTFAIYMMRRLMAYWRVSVRNSIF